MSAPSTIVKTRLIQCGDDQYVLLPAEMAFGSLDTDLVIERHGEELRIRPAPRTLAGVLDTLAQFSPAFMSEGRPAELEGDRQPLNAD